MSVGDLVVLVVVAACAVAAIAPGRREHSRPTSLRFWLAYLVNELPAVAGAWVAVVVGLAALDGGLDAPSGIVGLVLAVGIAAMLAVIVRRAVRARAAIEAAGRDAVGAEAWPPRSRWTWTRWARILLWPLPWLIRPGVAHTRDVPYGPAGRHHRLDVYRPSHGMPNGRILIHFHGGAFRHGRKNLDAQPLINRLVANGWVCVSANYRLAPDAVFPDQLVDAKRAIAWTARHAAGWSADAGSIVVAGSSAGGHIAAMAALTQNDPAFQPGFEAADTSVLAAVCLYPYSGPVASRGPASSPLDLVGPHAPPFFVVSGSHDTLVVPSDVRRFTDALRARSRDVVVAAELPGAQHGFDLVHSIRSEHVADAIDAFTTYVLAR